MSQAEDSLDDAELNSLEEDADRQDGIDESGRCVYCCKPERYCNCNY